MQTTEPQIARAKAGAAEEYSPVARSLHWWTVLILVVQIPLGFVMSYRANDLNLSDALTNNMYSVHKIIGMIFMVLIVCRLGYRLTNGAPPDEPTLNAFEKFASHATHWALYLLLLAMVVSGWVGISVYEGQRTVFGVFDIPAVAPINAIDPNLVFLWHKYFGIGIVALVTMHVAAALFHHVVKRDGVLARMLPAVRR